MEVTNEMIEAFMRANTEAKLFSGRSPYEAARIALTAALAVAPQDPIGWTLVHDKHLNALADGMAEVKATSDGRSDQPIADIVSGVIAEIAGAPSPIQGFAALAVAPGVKVKPLETHVAGIKTSIDTMREAAKDVLVKRGWEPGNMLGFHSITSLMAEFGMQVYRGEVGCDYPNCGCCADAACDDAIKQHPDLGGRPIAPTDGGGTGDQRP